MPPEDHADLGPVLSRALKLLRRRRGMTVAQIAARMKIASRTYEYFEAGEGELKVERVHAAARALSADPYAIFAAMEFGSADFALRCADNKLVSLLLFALQDFDAEARDAIALLDPQTLMSSFERLFRELAAFGRERANLTDLWGGGGEPDAD